MPEKTGDPNWYLERMQVEKDKGNVQREKDYVNKDKDPDAAMGKR